MTHPPLFLSPYRIVLDNINRSWFNQDGVLVFFDWLNENMGSREGASPLWDIRGTNPICVYFRDASDAMWFKLTWV